MPVMLVRNNTPGPLVLVDESGPSPLELTWEGVGDASGRDVQEVPESLARSIHFRRAVHKGNLSILKQEADALMQEDDESWLERQKAIAAAQPTEPTSPVPTQAKGESGEAIPVVVDKQAAQPLMTMQMDEQGNIVESTENPEASAANRGRQPQPAQGVPQVAGGHLDPNQP